MDSKDKDSAVETEKCKRGAQWKVVLGVIVVLIILVNTLWNMTDNKIGEVKSDLAALDSRVTEAEKESVDIEAVKAGIVSIKAAEENFNKRMDGIKKSVEDIDNKLNAVIKAGEGIEKNLNAIMDAEESKLMALRKELAQELENQKIYLNELKTLLEEIHK